MVREYVQYLNGQLYWIKKPSRKIKIGAVAGSRCAGDYLAFKLFGVRYAVHTYVWELHHGPVPEGKFVDHINRNKHDNRIENLRLADPCQNSANSSRLENRNCYWNSRVGMWQVRVQFRGRHHHAGKYFKTIEEARAAAVQLRKEVHGEFSQTF